MSKVEQKVTYTICCRECLSDLGEIELKDNTVTEITCSDCYAKNIVTVTSEKNAFTNAFNITISEPPHPFYDAMYILEAYIPEDKIEIDHLEESDTHYLFGQYDWVTDEEHKQELFDFGWFKMDGRWAFKRELL